MRSRAIRAARRVNQAFAGAGTPWRRPSSTISPFSQSVSIEPFPRARLCAEEPPNAGAPSTGARRSSASRRGSAAPTSRQAMPAASQHRLGLGAQDRVEAAVRRIGAERRLDDVVQVHQQLAVLACHHVRIDEPGDVRRAERLGQRLVVAVSARGIAADVEDAMARGPVRRHLARRDVARRHHHRDAVHVREEPQRHPLVRDPVLHAEDRLVGDAGRPQPLERRGGVLGLHRQEDRVVGLEGEVGGVADAGELRRARAARRPEQEPALADRGELPAARDADDGRPAIASAAAIVPPIAPTP